MAFIAAPLVTAHPPPEIRAAMKSCQGAIAIDQPTMPAAVKAAPQIVVAAKPKARCTSGRKTMIAAPPKKCVVTAAEITAIDQPFVSCKL